jgi:hypothetical protein
MSYVILDQVGDMITLAVMDREFALSPLPSHLIYFLSYRDGRTLP